MLVSIFFIIIKNFYISFKINFVSAINFFKDVIVFRISQTYMMS